MFGAIARRLFGTANDRLLKTLTPQLDAINALEPTLVALSDEELRARTGWLKERLTQGETVDDIMVDAFATVREAAKRVLGQRHFDTQLLGGMVLNKGMIAEMRTGEGKTLVSTLPTYLSALTGKGVHVVTVNDYLARRDSEWMGRIHRFLGLTVGCILHELTDSQRQEAYRSDITYGTNNEFGFDYLRDNMKFRLDDMVQRSFNHAIIDEVDSILIDEARTPLIISGAPEQAAELYAKFARLAPRLKPGKTPEGMDPRSKKEFVADFDYEFEEKYKTVSVTEQGVETVERLLEEHGLLKGGTLYDVHNVNLVHHVNQALRAHKLFTRDVDYIVKDDKVVIIDEFTGRMMEGRRYSEGLHQALEAKEHVTIQNENQTLASITFQNYFRLYPKLSGMTGTAMTEASEFGEIYSLEVVDIPTNLPVQRKDEDDEVYRTAKEKYEAICDLIEACRKKQQPVLVGTVSIEKSEMLSGLLAKRKIPHEVLNARHHEREAQIVSLAGVPGAVMIATNMAGRGTDIQLGGNIEMRLAAELAGIEDEAARKKGEAEIRAEIAEKKKIALEAGGLYVIGTERHESRRIDNQLRGRSGRQGDPGASKFFLSLDDDLMRIFGSQRMDGMLQKLGLKEGEAIIHPWINKALEKAQQKVEARNFDIRKNLLKYDDVMNDQRKVIYEQRKELMSATDVGEEIVEMRKEVVENLVNRCIPERAYPEQWDVAGLHEEALRIFNVDVPAADWAKEEGIESQAFLQRLTELTDAKAAEKAAAYGPDIVRMVEKSLLLQILDQSWKDHLLTLDHLRQGIGLRAYGQRDPLNEYKREAFNLFEEMLGQLREKVTTVLSHLELRIESDPAAEAGLQREPQTMVEGHQDPAFAAPGDQPPPLPAHITAQDLALLSRNAPCPCGSGKKFKHCHGAVA